MSNPQSPLRLDDQLCFALYDASHAMTACYRPLLEELGLTYPQYLVLLVLWEHDTAEPITVNVLGERVGLKTGTLSPLLKRLDAAGLVLREHSVDDERRVHVRLTPAGRRLHRRAARAQARVEEQTGLSRAELARMRERLHELSASLRGEQDSRRTA